MRTAQSKVLTMDQDAVSEKRSWEYRRHPNDREVDVELLAFVERYATELLKWDIVAFLGNNPHTYDTAWNIARFIGRNPHAVTLELGDLAILGLLSQIRADGEIIYHLTPNRALREATLKFVGRLKR
jgi:hypothetical protein